MLVSRGNPDSLKAPGFLRGGQFTSTVGCSISHAGELLALRFLTVTSSYPGTQSCLYGLRAPNKPPGFGPEVHSAGHLDG